MTSNKEWTGVANWATGSKNPPAEAETGKSVTVPDQVMDVAEIVARFVRKGEEFSLPPGGSSDVIPIGWEKFDKLERLEMSRLLDEDIAATRERIRLRQEAVKKAQDLEHQKTIKAFLDMQKSPEKGDSAEGLLPSKQPGQSKP